MTNEGGDVGPIKLVPEALETDASSCTEMLVLSERGFLPSSIYFHRDDRDYLALIFLLVVTTA